MSKYGVFSGPYFPVFGLEKLRIGTLLMQCLVDCNIVNKYYQLDSRILFTLVLNKSFDELLDIPPKTVIFLKTFHSYFHILRYGLLTKL